MSATVVDTNDLKFIPVSEIRENKEALRSVDRQNEQFMELAASVRNKGILNPILVCQMADSETGESFFALVDGLQRFTAAKDAGMDTVPALVKPQSEVDILANQLITNAIRVETKPVEYTKQIQRLMQLNPMLTLTSLANSLGKSDSWLKQRLDLLKLTPKAAELVDEGQINVTNAYALSKLPTEVQEEYLDKAREMSHLEFLPEVVNKKKELDKARREGRKAEPEVFKPVPKLLKLPVIEEQIKEPVALAKLLEDQNCSTALEGALAALNWVIGLDPKSVAAQQVKWDEQQAAKAAKKHESELEKSRRAALVQDYKSRRFQVRTQLIENGLTGEELEAKLKEWDEANPAPGKKAEAEAEAAAA